MYIGKKKKKIIVIMYGMLAITFLCMAIYFCFFYNYQAYKRQEKEESLADDYINYLVNNEDKKESSQVTATVQTPEVLQIETETSNREIFNHISFEGETKVIDDDMEIIQTEYIDDDGIKHIDMTYEYNFDYEDEDYLVNENGVEYTPDYAAGYLFCVLKYPACGIKRGVYSGTWEDRDHNQDFWIPNIGNPYMRFGYTHITIEGHNHTVQNLSFNALNRACIGDRYELISDDGIYIYEVADIYAMSRDCVREKLINDLELGVDKSFIVTCGRDNFPVKHFREYDFAIGKWCDSYSNGVSSRYYDYIVEGHLVEKKDICEIDEEIK